MIAVKLKFRSPLHVGVDSIDSAGTIVHSDTLFGAIGSVLPLLGKDTKAFVDSMRDGGAVSSLYPFENDTYYLPKPLHANSVVMESLGNSTKDYVFAKKFRKASLITKEAFEMIINRNIDTSRIEGLIPTRLPLRVIDVPKVAIDRVTSNSNIFYLTQVHFASNSGLYFLYDGDVEIFDEYILPALRFLGDEGLGGRRSWGLGLFSVEVVDDFEIAAPKGKTAFVTLSMVLPSSKSELLQWEPVKRSGWVHTVSGKPRRKPTMIFAAEGSLVSENSGRILDLDSIGSFSLEVGHKIYVYGKSFPIPAEVDEV